MSIKSTYNKVKGNIVSKGTSMGVVCGYTDSSLIVAVSSGEVGARATDIKGLKHINLQYGDNIFGFIEINEKDIKL